MSIVQFEVSAKTARLIGRENISDVDGAIIELIKNAYDADATCVFAMFDMPFPKVPNRISYETINSVFGKDPSALLEYYSDDGISFVKRSSLSKEQELKLVELLFSHNSIIIVDNGCGMDEKTLRYAWMNIGTNDKEEKRVSPKGRVKTGAKGIGRFALDKLSTETTVYTKNSGDLFKKWHINWNQFETANLLNEVTASIDDQTGEYADFAASLIHNRFNGFDNYSWDTGTIIKLCPLREAWSENYFNKVNNNLKSLFPSTNNSQFDIFVSNLYYPKYSFNNERFALTNAEYDYKIVGSFDGEDILRIRITRNEIDTRKIKIAHQIGEENIQLMLNEFWARDAFIKEKHIRSDYAKTVEFQYSANELTKIAPDVLSSVGPFTTEFYFLKNTPSNNEIVLPVVSSRRKEILANYSGIKLYRDGFKVRPYGEIDGNFDWLSLGLRAQKSPAAVSHQNGSWRVRTNQIIGEVRISKDNNPYLMDMANREGLAINDAYKSFLTLIDKVIETFEYDRQYVFKEYAAWIKEKETALSNTQKVVDSAKGKKAEVSSLPHDENSEETHEGQNFSKSDYENAIIELDKERERQERATKTMMLYSSAGVMTNTFSHEISRIMTKAGSRMQQLRETVKRSVGEYTGSELFNPYTLIDRIENVDNLLENWLSVLMSGTKEDVYSAKTNNLFEVINNIIDRWRPLLKQKLIDVLPIEINNDKNEFLCYIPEIDLLIIMNNFLLNSADFLEKATVPKRQISISIFEYADKYIIELKNNGPKLDGIFSNNPDRIFDAGISTKQTGKGKGSGIGLWITRTLVLNNSGEIHTMDLTDGFGLRIQLPR